MLPFLLLHCDVPAKHLPEAIVVGILAPAILPLTLHLYCFVGFAVVGRARQLPVILSKEIFSYP